MFLNPQTLKNHRCDRETNFNLKQHKILKSLCEKNGQFIYASFQLELQRNLTILVLKLLKQDLEN